MDAVERFFAARERSLGEADVEVKGDSAQSFATEEFGGLRDVICKAWALWVVGF